MGRASQSWCWKWLSFRNGTFEFFRLRPKLEGQRSKVRRANEAASPLLEGRAEDRVFGPEQESTPHPNPSPRSRRRGDVPADRHSGTRVVTPYHDFKKLA